MIQALLYLQYQSTRNRFISRLKQFKRPAFIIGLVISGLYFYFFLIRNLFLFGNPMDESPWSSSGWFSDPQLAESLGALVLLVIVLFMWLVPRKRAMLAFTEAEVAFLFPAPITRHGLIHFKLLRCQLGLLLSVLFLTVISSAVSGSGRIFYHAAGFWVILSTLNLHSVGASFTLTMLMDRGLSTRKQRFAILTPVFAGLVVVGVWMVRTLPLLAAHPLANIGAAADYGRQMLIFGPMPILLYPFRLIMGPFLATDASGMLHMLWPALLLLAAHYWWVIRSNVAFEEASVETSKKLAKKFAAMRAGDWQTPEEKYKGKRPPFRLAPVGHQSVALLWKNLIGAGREFTSRAWIMLAAVVPGILLMMWVMATLTSWLLVVNAFLVTLVLWSLLMGPLFLRHDFRQDLPQADMLKMYPMRGWQIALGEILAPALLLTTVQWLLLILLAVFLLLMGGSHLGYGRLVVIVFTPAILLPMFNLISWLIPNAIALLFPIWFRASKESACDIRAVTYQMIFAAGQFLVFTIALLPAATVFFVLIKFVPNTGLTMPVAAVVAALVLAVEAALGVLLLGSLFERFDVSAESVT